MPGESYLRQFRSLLLCPLSVERYYFPWFIDSSIQCPLNRCVWQDLPESWWPQTPPTRSSRAQMSPWLAWPTVIHGPVSGGGRKEAFCLAVFLKWTRPLCVWAQPGLRIAASTSARPSTASFRTLSTPSTSKWTVKMGSRDLCCCWSPPPPLSASSSSWWKQKNPRRKFDLFSSSSSSLWTL